MSSSTESAALLERVGQSLTVRACVWPRGQRPKEGVVEVADQAARGLPSASLLVEASDRSGGAIFKALVHGYGACCAEEVELWEKPGLILVGVGQAVTVLDSASGQVRLRVPMGGYFNSLWLAEDGRDAFICGDEQVVRLVPPGVISWQKTLGVDGVMVHRAVGPTVFVSAQRRVGGPWVDFLLDRMSGNVVEAPDPEDDGEQSAARAAPATDRQQGTTRSTAAPTAGRTSPRTASKPAPREEKNRPDDEDEDAGVRLVRDDETDPDDE